MLNSIHFQVSYGDLAVNFIFCCSLLLKAVWFKAPSFPVVTNKMVGVMAVCG